MVSIDLHRNGTGEYTRIQKNAGELQGNTGEYRGKQENTGESKKTQGDTREYKGILGNNMEPFQ